MEGQFTIFIFQYQHSNPNLFSKQEQFTIFFQYQHNHRLKERIFSMEGQFTISALKP